jgi:hypothetical protein
MAILSFPAITDHWSQALHEEDRELENSHVKSAATGCTAKEA